MRLFFALFIFYSASLVAACKFVVVCDRPGKMSVRNNLTNSATKLSDQPKVASGYQVNGLACENLSFTCEEMLTFWIYDLVQKKYTRIIKAEKGKAFTFSQCFATQIGISYLVNNVYEFFTASHYGVLQSETGSIPKGKEEPPGTKKPVGLTHTYFDDVKNVVFKLDSTWNISGIYITDAESRKDVFVKEQTLKLPKVNAAFLEGVQLLPGHVYQFAVVHDKKFYLELFYILTPEEKNLLNP